MKRFHKTPRAHNKHDVSPSGSKGSGFITYTLVGATLVTAGTAAYAKFDPAFRKWLADNVPYSDSGLRLVFQEDTSYSQSFIGILDSTKSLVGLKPEIVEKPKSYQRKYFK